MNVQAETDVSDEEISAITANLMGLFKAGGTLGDVMNLTRREREAMYAMGHTLYAQGKHRDALLIFAQLVQYDHMESRYQMALASAMQACKQYEEALRQHLVVAMMRVNDPVPIYHSAECLLALGRSTEAGEALEMVIGDLCEPGKHDDIRLRAQALLQAIRQKTQSGQS